MQTQDTDVIQPFNFLYKAAFQLEIYIFREFCTVCIVVISDGLVVCQSDWHGVILVRN